MGRKSRLKWERRSRDGWPLQGADADTWRLMVESARRRPVRHADLFRVMEEEYARTAASLAASRAKEADDAPR